MISVAQQLLKKYYGYEQFRPLQAEIIAHVLNKKDVVVLMPTGGGKSICFQLPALLIDGLCLVISPLISLMKDQVKALTANGIPAMYLNSSLSQAEETQVFQECRAGKYKLLYISPEKLVSSFDYLLHRLNVQLVAIDEAHCISSWGHDFRPEYTQLKLIKQYLPEVPVIALTATADKITRRDIIKQLQLNEPEVFVASFDRPNLSLTVRAGLKEKEKLSEILHFIDAREGQSGIIYCLSRKTTEELAATLRSSNVNAQCYHAGLSNDERNHVQDDFINDKVGIICATVAFGMGIDKSNVRWVIHYNLPKNIEGYYQEIGRAGRDGLPGDTVLYFNFSDLAILSKFAAEGSQAALNMEKLNRMQQYAEANICRRKILISYFSETFETNCGNCDVCKNPRSFFDGTLIAQKALSALLRLNEKVGVTMLIDVLRGSSKGELKELGYHKIKTYGAGADISFNDWQQYILQLLNLGVIEIAYDEGFSLKVAPFGRQVLFENKKLELAVLIPKEIKQKATAKVKSKRETQQQQAATPEDALFNTLRKLRKFIAEQNRMPAYIVFSDATLREMATERPVTEEDFLAVSGVGQHKFELYGQVFLNAIQADSNNTGTQKLKTDTYIETFALYQQGLAVEEIAQKRNLNPTTIYSHLAHLYQKGAAIDISRYVSAAELKKIKQVVAELGNTEKLKPVFDALNGEVDYNKIRLALATLN